MRDKGVNAKYLVLNEHLKVVVQEIPFETVFNTDLPNEKIYFDFESKYLPYQKFSYDDIGAIDLTVKDQKGKFLRPLEIKLTVLPDNSAHQFAESKWGSELVVRPASTKYCALGAAETCSKKFKSIREIIEPVCHNIRDWGNEFEIIAKMPNILDAINDIQRLFLNKQKPFLLQPIWKTKGKNPILSKNAFDIFVWSDFALSRLFLDSSKNNLKKNKVMRQTRSSTRLARFLYQISASGKSNLNSIYTEMAFNHQTDKEFSVNGGITRKHMISDELKRPRIKSSELKSIILNGGEKKLSPERRFDQTVYYTVAEILKN